MPAGTQNFWPGDGDPGTPPRPFRGPRWTSSEAELARALAPLGLSKRTFSAFGLNGDVSFRPRETEPGPRPEILAFLGDSGRTALVGLSGWSLIGLTPEVRGLNPALLPEPLRFVLLDAYARPLLGKLAELLGFTPRLTAAAPETTWPERGRVLRFSLRITGPPGVAQETAAVAFPKDVDRNFLLAALAQTPFPKVADFGHLALPYALTVGGVDLTFDEIAHLTVGDLLIPDDPPILAGQAFYAPLDFSAKSFSPRPERAGGPAVPNAKETPVADPKAPAPTAPEPETSAQSLADNLSLPLSFEVGRKTLTVRELESLAPGAIIAVDHDPTQPVTVACHGQPVARGTLVDLGDGRLGVALTAVLQGVGDPLSQAKSRNE